jgi:hypothetical protein
MTPKEKAEQLATKFEKTIFGYDVFDEDWIQCIDCASVAVDEIIEVLELIDTPTTISLCYWYHEVKQEIANL